MKQFASLRDLMSVEFVVEIENDFSVKVLSCKNGVLQSMDDFPLRSDRVTAEVKEDGGCYIFFTSGTTGSSKAILGQHKSLSHFIHWQMNEFKITRDFRTGQVSGITFDASLRDVLLPLLSGAVLCIPGASVRNNPVKLLKWLANEKIHLIHTVPSMFRMLTRELDEIKSDVTLPHLKHILLAGEPVYAKDISRWYAAAGRSTEIVNLYGTTETTMCKTFFRISTIPENPNQVISVGIAISNSAIAVINDGRACATHEVGEVYIKTPFTSKGYVDDEALNRQCFVQNPLVSDRVDIVYKTGDLGKLNTDGTLDIVGRIDDQVKVNGVRMNLQNIEREILKIHQVQEAVVVLLKTDDRADLVCYYSGTETPHSDLLLMLQNSIENSVMPNYFVYLEKLPLTINGKVDKKQLPPPDELLLSSAEYETPQGDDEQQLEKIFGNLLNLKRVSRTASFFKLGGSSLRALMLISHLYKAFHAEITLKEIYENNTIEKLCKLIKLRAKSPYQAVPRVVDSEMYNLSYGQGRLWVLSKLEQNQSAYHMLEAQVIEGDLNLSTLEASFNFIVKRHESLRTVFCEVEGQAFQKVIPPNKFKLEISYLDIKDHNEKALDALIEEQATMPFDLLRGPLFRLSIISLTPTKHLYVFVVHHIVCDGWSLEILSREFNHIYKELLQQREPSLPSLQIQYRDYAQWQNAQMHEAQWVLQKDYWKNRFDREIPPLELPLTYSRPRIRSSQGGKEHFVLKADIVKDITTFTAKYNSSIFPFLMAVVNVLLYKYSRQETIVIGSPVAGRTREEFEGQVGFYANTLPFLTVVNGAGTFNELLQNVNTVVLEGLEHQQFPFDLLVEELKIERDMARSPLFDVMVVLQNTNEISKTKSVSDDFHIYPLPTRNFTSKFDLTFNFLSVPDEIILNLEHSADIFSSQSVKRILGHFENIVGQAIKDPLRSINSIDLLMEHERKQLLNDFGGVKRLESLETSVVKNFRQQCALSPDSIAVIYRDNQLSYKVLEAMSNQLCRYFIETCRVRTEDFVVVMAERSHWMIVTMLGIWKAGCAYVPVDPTYPLVRINYILDDAAPSVIVTDKPRAGLHLPTGCKELVIPEAWRIVDALSDMEMEIDNRSNDLSYMIYTSGSTGVPKGAMVEHGGMINHLYAKVHDLQMDRSTVLVQNASQGFDVSIWQAISALLTGGSTVVYDNDLVLDPTELVRQVERDRVSILEIVPSYLDTILSLIGSTVTPAFENLRYLVVTGETLPQSLVAKWFELFPGIPLVNAYGPTEASDDITHHIMLECPRKGHIPVGKTVQNLSIYVMDNSLNLCPIEVKGEICVAGIGVGRGYWKKPQLTERVFVEDPFQKGVKMYRTGDVGRFTAEGVLEFFGRFDSQVKVRGYRIELNEIESRLSVIAGIRQCVVMVEKDVHQQNYISSYVTTIAESGLTPSSLKALASKTLPHYMTPSFIVILPEMPVTPNGKIDRKALMAFPKLPGQSKKGSIAPRNITEERLFEIWKNVLEINDFSVDDNFFEIGGHSLKATRMLSFIMKEFKVRIDLRFIFENPTIDSIAKKIVSSPTVQFNEIEPLPLRSLYSASPAQVRFWLIDQWELIDNHYNVFISYSLKGDPKIEILRAAFLKLVDRHEILRTVFVSENSVLNQKILMADSARFDFEVHDFSHLSDSHERALRNFDTLSKVDFDLMRGPLMKIQIAKVAADRYYFFLVMPHMITDGWSMQLLLREILILYNSFSRGLSSPLRPLKIQYKDFAEWHNQQLQGQGLLILETHWLSKLQNLPTLNLPIDHKRTALTTYNGRSISFNLDHETTKRLHDLSYRFEASLYMTYMSFLFSLLHRYSKQTDIVVGTPVAGRTHVDLEEVMGCFINILPLRVKFNGGGTFSQLVQDLKGSFISDHEHQMYPYERMIQKLNTDFNVSKSRLFDVVFVFQNAQVNMKTIDDLDKLKISPLYLENAVSRLNLELLVTEHEDLGISTVFNYNTDVFTQETVEEMVEDFKKIIFQVLANPHIELSSFSRVTSNASERVITTNTKSSTVLKKNSISIFERSVERHPQKIAVSSGNRIVSFDGLNRKANRLAHYLIDTYHVKPSVRVGLMMSRSVDLIISVLALLKVGATCIPIDGRLSPRQKDRIIKDSGIPILLFSEDTRLESKGLDPVMLNLHDLQLSESESTDSNPMIDIGPEILRYSLLKEGVDPTLGLKISEEAMMNRLASLQKTLVGPEEHLLTAVPFAFDDSFLDLVSAVCAGISVTLLPNVVPARNFDQYVRSELKDFNLSLYHIGGAQDLRPEYRDDYFFSSTLYADKNGFNSLWVPELYDRVTSGSFSLAAAGLAMFVNTTKCIQLRAVYPLPARDFIRVAEDINVLDNLSNGRLGVCVGTGDLPNEFIAYPDKFENRKMLFREDLLSLKAALDGHSIARRNGLGKETSVRIFPHHVQKDVPIWIDVTSESLFAEAGKQGTRLFVHLAGQDIVALARNIQIYEEAFNQARHDVTSRGVTVSLLSFVSSDDQNLEDIIKRPLKSFVDNHPLLVHKSWRDLNVDELMEQFQLNTLCGTVSFCKDVIRQLLAIGVDEIACITDFGVEPKFLLPSLENLKKVMDEIKTELTEMSEKQPVTVLQTTPSLLKTLSQDSHSHKFFSSLTHLLIDGRVRANKRLSETVEENHARGIEGYETTSGPIIPNVVPGDEVEQLLLGIFCEMLNVDKIGIRSDFFTLGGHSIVAMRIMTKIQTVFNVSLKIRALFSNPTVEKLAIEVRKAIAAARVEEESVETPS
jgi:amino acid adenylation domain-containing protein/natural product biosynthesis luciferase-like monooxygenase protein